MSEVEILVVAGLAFLAFFFLLKKIVKLTLGFGALAVIGYFVFSNLN
jgi:hypothetical protein